MHVYLTARRFDLTDDIRDHVERKLIDPLRSHNSLTIPRVEVQIYRETERGSQVGCHVLVELTGHVDINVREIAGDAPTTIDLVHDRVMPLVTEHRDRALTLARHPRKSSSPKLT